MGAHPLHTLTSREVISKVDTSHHTMLNVLTWQLVLANANSAGHTSLSCSSMPWQQKLATGSTSSVRAPKVEEAAVTTRYHPTRYLPAPPKPSCGCAELLRHSCPAPKVLCWRAAPRLPLHKGMGMLPLTASHRSKLTPCVSQPHTHRFPHFLLPVKDGKNCT